MYEENLAPLPRGDFSQVFARVLEPLAAAHAQHASASIMPDGIFHLAEPEIQAALATICRRLLLPGSGVLGQENLAQLVRLAEGGRSCIVCLNHQSNLDAPTLQALLEDQGAGDLFGRLLWIAGRKLHEDVGLTPLLVRGVNRVFVSPRSWIEQHHSAEELHDAHLINLAAHRVIHALKTQGWVFALFPTGTRARPLDASTQEALEETDGYLKHFEYMLLGRIDGCTLPVSRDRDLAREVPRLDRVRYTFDPVIETDVWRTNAARRFEQLDRRRASARAIMEDIRAI